MRSLKYRLPWLMVYVIAIAAFPGRLVAETAEKQCRAAVRAEMMGANCRTPDPKSSADPCFIPGESKLALYNERVVQCVARGGPGKR
jgi:hypothetical protein